MVKGSCSINLFTVILLTLVLVSPSISPAPSDSACGEWRRVPELQGRSVNSVLVHALAVFVATDDGVFKSEDGLNWHPTSLRLSTYSLASFQGELLAGTEDGVYISMDGGVTWRAIGLRGERVTALAVSGNVIYAGTQCGVYRKEEGGDWKATSLTQPTKSLAADPANPNLVYAGTGGGALGKTWGDLYLSANGGSTWSRAWLSNATFLVLLAMGIPLYYEVTCITINPCNPKEVFAGTFAIFTVLVVVPMKAGALHVSRDCGGSWESIGPDLKCVFAIRVSRGCRSLILGTDNGVYISEDGGRSWYHLGPANETVRAVESRGTEIYAGTASGLLVYHQKTYPTRVSLRVEPSWIPALASTHRVRLSGNLTSLGERLPGKTLKVLLNGVEAGSCRTGEYGNYECTPEWPTTGARTVNLTMLYPGDSCYNASWASRQFYLINATTAHGKVEGSGWYLEESSATISVASTVVSEGLTEYVFKGWRVEGIITFTEPVLVLTVSEPMEIEAVWERRLSIVALTVVAAVVVVVAASLLLVVILVARERRA